MTIGKPTVQNQYLGVFYMLISVLAWAILDGITKKLTDHYSLFQIIFLRDGINVLLLLFLGIREGGLKIFKPHKSFALHGWRSLFAMVNAVGYTYAISKLSLSDVYTLGFSAPLFMIILSKIMQAEPINTQRWVCLILGFLGIVVVLRPGKEIFDSAGVIALMTGIFYAISTLLVNKFDSNESSYSITFYPTLASCVLGAVSALSVPHVWAMPSLKEGALFALLGALAALAQYTGVKAVRFAPISLIAPLEYSSLVWVVLIDYFLFELKIDLYLAVGIVFIVGSNLYLIFHEGQTVLKKRVK